jgi:hypothetical protein
MSTQPIPDESPLTADRTSEIADAQAVRHADTGQHTRSRVASTSAQEGPSFDGGSRLIAAYLPGDFAEGQRTRPRRVRPVGTFATR